jgi:hypothetical protein
MRVENIPSSVEPERRPMGKIFIVLATFVLMVEFGVSAYVVSLHVLLSSIPKSTEGPFAFLRIGALTGGAIGFLAPGAVVWYLLKEEHHWHFSRRTMFILITLMTFLLGVIVLLYHSGIWV